MGREKKRINYDNIFYVFVDKDNCTDKVLLDFEKLTINKKNYTYRDNKNLLNSVVINNCLSDDGLWLINFYENRI